MHRHRKLLRWFSGLLLAVASCRSSQPDLKPPPQPEDFRLPPPNETRFNNPIVYPKETLDSDGLKGKSDISMPKAGSGFGSPGGMGRFN